jgi:dTDP-4-dehydrorhamnose 3,5-epimerase
VIFSPTKLAGAIIVEIEPHPDERGFFARSFCEREFAERGLCARYPQCNISYNRQRGTLRGMHFNRAPHEEAKLVRCQAGSIYDVIVDLRPGSGTLGQWLGVELSAQNRRMLYIPPGLAHGFLTLCDEVEVFYHMSNFYVPDAGVGLRYDDPAIGIQWPEAPRVISERDRTYPDWQPEASAEDPSGGEAG